MEIQFLGTGAGNPSKTRNVSSLALKLLQEINQIWLFDCGEGTQHQILRTTIRPKKITHLFITHLHGDHIFGLPGFLSSRSFQTGEETPKLTIYGPPGIKEYVNTSIRLSHSKLTYPLDIIELNPEGGSFTLAEDWSIHYLPLNHGILSFGFRIKQPTISGELLVDKLADYPIQPGPLYGKLKRGESVRLDDGTVLNGPDFIGPEKQGKIITILGDTKPHKNIQRLAQDADLLVHEGTHEPGEEKMANRYFHSTMSQAAQIAQKANVKQLLINHISARYLTKDVQTFQKQLRKDYFKTITIAYDFMEISID